MPTEINREIFDQLKDILEEDFMIVIDGFFSEGARLVDRMDEGVEEANFDTIRDVAHTMKSMSGNLGAMALSGCADDLQVAAVNEDIVAIKQILPVFLGLYRKAIDEIKSLT